MSPIFMRVTRTTAAIAAVLAAVVFVPPSAAQAATYTPPVPEIPDLPSRTSGLTSAGNVGDDVIAKSSQLWLGLREAISRGPVATGSTTTTVPKPITKPKTPVNSVGGELLAAGFGLGWAVGQGGLMLYAAATGSEYSELVCGDSVPDWYEAANSFMTFGMADCAAIVPQPNIDTDIVWGPVTYDGWTRNFVGFAYSGSAMYACFTGSGTMPSDPTVADDGTRYLPQFIGPSGEYWSVRKSAGSSSYLGMTSTGSAGKSYTCQDAFPGTYASRVDFSKVFTTWINSEDVWPQFGQLVIKNVDTGEFIVQADEVHDDPERTPQCTVTWESGAVTTGEGTPYRESEGLPTTAEGLGCQQAWEANPDAGPDELPADIGVESETPDGARTPIMDDTIPEYTPDQRKSLTVDPSVPGQGLVLEKAEADEYESCNRWEADCAGWWEATQSGTQPSTDTGTTTETYRCLYGGEAVDLAECGPYRYTFDTRTSTPTITDPDTGEETPWPIDENLNSTSPETGPTPGQACMAAWGSSPNPIEWVLTPVKCALVWAFVPRATVVDAATAQLSTAWSDTGLGKLSLTISAWSFTAPRDGCGGVLIPISNVWPTTDDFSILNACPGDPLADTAALSSMVLGIVGVIASVIAVTRAVGGVVGYGGVGGGRVD